MTRKLNQPGGKMHTTSRFRAAPMAAISAALVIVALALAGGAQANTRAERQRALSHIQTFAFALGAGTGRGDLRERFKDYDLVVLDPDETNAKRVKQLRSQGKVVLAYLSIGTIEKGRFWYRSVKKYRLKDKFDYFDEYYARTSASGFRKVMLRVARRYLRRKKVDGLFLDNTDFIADHPKQTRGLRRLVRLLARLTHRRDKFLFSQNGEDLIKPVLKRYDGWNRESFSWTIDFNTNHYQPVPPLERMANQRGLARIKRAGLLTTTTDYTDGNQAAFDDAVSVSCANGAVPYVSNIELTRIPHPAPSC